MKKYLIIILLTISQLGISQVKSEFKIKLTCSPDKTILNSLNGSDWKEIIITDCQNITYISNTGKEESNSKNEIDNNSYLFSITSVKDSPQMFGGFKRLFELESFKGSAWVKISFEVHIDDDDDGIITLNQLGFKYY